MKCDHCDGIPVVTEVVVKDGKKVEHHLCEKCAAQMGITPQSHAPINELISKFVTSHGSAASKQAQSAARRCEGCGLTFGEFRKSGLMGCARCYEAFETQIGPLIERAHEGGTHHIGKIPRRAGASTERQERIGILRKQLSDAIESEQYERAAVLRDQIRRFEEGEEIDDAGPGASRAVGRRGGRTGRGAKEQR